MRDEGFPDEFYDSVAAMPEVPVTDGRIQQAAPGVALLLWRNTEAVENDAHADGPWSDADMLRMNARATNLCLEALMQVWNGEDGLETFLDLVENLAALLPTPEMQDKLWDASARKADFWGRAFDEFGMERVLGFFFDNPWMSAPPNWWLAPTFPALVEALTRMGPPDPDSFTERLLRRPWELTDEQAQFVCDHRYDV